jgi:1-acyl-sn-glycerol-3-phosphate acyltransferase
MMRSLLLVGLGIVTTGLFSAYAILVSLVFPGENRVHLVARTWARIMLALSGTKVEVTGAENVLADKPQVFMANHLSNFDIFIVLANIPGQFRWIAKKELFRFPLFGTAMRRAGYIEIDRQHHERALQSLDEAARKIREGKSVMTFPEGTRSRDGRIQPFKQGIFHLAIKAGVPIVPITIIGSGEIMPKRSLRVKPGTIRMIIDKPIDVTGYTIENRAALIELVRGVIVRNLERERPSPPATAAVQQVAA